MRMLVITLAFGLSPAPAFASAPETIHVPADLRQKLKSFEPSATVYLADLDLYLVSSDDTDKKDSPLLFLMNARGEVAAKAVPILGMEKMTDMESLSQDERYLYVMSSQGLNKNGKEKEERNQFLRARREGKSIVAEDIVALRPRLLKALRASRDSTLQSLAKRFAAEIDIESHFVRDGELFVGLKNPQPSPGVGLILSLGSVDALFRQQEISSVSIWRKLDFRALTGKTETISDIAVDGNRLLLSTTQEEIAGALWTYDLANERLTLKEEFTNLKPEGIAVPNRRGDSLVVFDQGEDDGLFTHRRF